MLIKEQKIKFLMDSNPLSKQTQEDLKIPESDLVRYQLFEKRLDNDNHIKNINNWSLAHFKDTDILIIPLSLYFTLNDPINANGYFYAKTIAANNPNIKIIILSDLLEFSEKHFKINLSEFYCCNFSEDDILNLITKIYTNLQKL